VRVFMSQVVDLKPGRLREVENAHLVLALYDGVW
jgi:hypothetical protein